MALYKKSYYNFFIPLKNDNYLIFNSLTNSLIEIERKKALLLKSFKNKTFEINSLSLFDNKEVKIITNNGMIIRSDYNEEDKINEITNFYKNLNKNHGQFSIVILPTNACNMNCPYCFEGKKNNEENMDKMDEGLIDSILHVLEKEIKNPITNKIQSLYVEWYGGEPLLAIDIIEKFSRKLIHFAQENDLKYISKMISNGVLLTKENWEILKKCKIDTIQVTLDGGRETHSIKRPLCNGKDSYDIIIENLKNIPDGIYVPLRINIDKEVQGTISNLLDDLELAGIWPQNANKIRPYFGFIDFIEKEESEFSEIYYSVKQYHEMRYKFKKELIDRYNLWAEKNNIKNRAKKKIEFPTRHSFTCSLSDLPYGIVIDSGGYIHKCMCPVNDKEDRMGHIDDFNSNRYLQKKWLDFKRLDVSKCKKCKILPICEENCTERLMREQPRCSEYKFFLKERILEYYYANF